MNANSLRTDVFRARFGGMLGGLLVLAAGSTALAQQTPRVVNVNCAQGDTIARALTRGNEQRPLLVLIRGTCNESVLIDRSDVTLRGETGFSGAIAGPDPNINTVTVTASRVAIEDLTITGGRNGIIAEGAARMAVRNATVQSTGRTGVTFSNGASGTIDGSTIRFNPRDGVTVSAAAAIVRTSTISQNSRTGVLVIQGGAAFIGTDGTLQPAGNTISQNGASGISVTNGATATIAMNQITGNGADPASPVGRSGVGVTGATADIAGGNVISGNTGQGIFARSASVTIGNTQYAFPTVNTITNNGDAASPGGIFATLGSAMVIRDAVVSANQGVGLGFSLRSNGQLSVSTIQNNTGDGIQLSSGSGLNMTSPVTVVSGNGGFGLQCFGGESSVINHLLFLDISGANGLGGISGSCTGF